MNNCFHLYGCQFRMVWGSLTRFSWDGCARNVNTFQYFFGLFNCFFFWLLQGEILIPASSLLFVLGPTNTHPHALQAAFCSSFPGTGEKETALKGRILSSWAGLFFHFCLGLLVGVVSSVDSCFPLPLSLSSQSPPGHYGEFTCWSSTSCAQDPGPWRNFPSASSLLEMLSQGSIKWQPPQPSGCQGPMIK